MRKDSLTRKEVALIDLKIKDLSTEKAKVDQQFLSANESLSRYVSDRDEAMQKVDRRIDQVNAIADDPLNALRSAGIVVIDTQSIVNNDYPTARSAFKLVDTSAPKMANLSSRLATNLSGIVDKARGLYQSIATATDSVATAIANSNNLKPQLSEANAMKQRLIAIGDSLPERIGKYYYRGGIAETIEVLWKFCQHEGKIDHIHSRRYPRAQVGQTGGPS